MSHASVHFSRPENPMGAYTNPIYPYKAPTDLMSTPPQRRPLIVIGAGPVGLAAAIDAR